MITTPLYEVHSKLGATFGEISEGWNFVLHYSDPISEHLAVRNDVGIADISHHGVLCLTGEDRAKFLHRLISNDVETLSVGEGNYATLLTHRGKIIADINVYNLDDSIYISTAPEIVETLFSELDKYIIADDVELMRLKDIGIIAVSGPNSPELLHSIFNIDNIANLPEYYSKICELNQQRVICVRSDIYGEIGYRLFTTSETLGELWKKLITHKPDVKPIGWEAQESLRIEAGIPRYGTELTDSIIPLEAELEHAIDFEKGCYIGQEIVARMKYRGHPNRLLRGIELHSDHAVQQNSKIFDSEKEVGWVTSSVFSPSLGIPIALGYIRMALTEPGSRIQIEVSDGRINGRVVGLPFLSRSK